jgi:cytochrome c-type biogenesis protein CcmF
MLPELGHFSLILALLAALLQAGLSLAGARDQPFWQQAGRRAALLNFALTLLAFALLVQAFVASDFSVTNVYMNSHMAKPLLYKISGSWGSHEGSLLLWLLIMAGFGAAMAHGLKAVPADFKARAVGVQGLLSVGFLLFVLFTSNPFARIFPVPPQGRDLNPLLQDPGLAFHPPLLYIGYVGFSAVFALAVAQLLSTWPAAPWAKWVRPYALVAWSFLTGGLALGSWWAYYELGWGGWWFWDPVENAALMPWLAGTALLHSLLATWQRGAFARWTVLLALITFGLSMIGAFLVRSGVLTSVHSFANDPQRGLVLLGLFVLALGGAFTLYARRMPDIRGNPMFGALSRESAFLLNNLLLCAACATVMIGTLYPLLLDALGGGMISVGAPYFMLTVVPMLLPLLVLMGFAPWLKWRSNDGPELLRRLGLVALLTLVAVLVLGYQAGMTNILGLAALGLGCWLLIATLQAAWEKRRVTGFTLAHGGLALAVLGMAGSAFDTQHNLHLYVGEATMVGSYRLELAAVEPVQGKNFTAERAVVRIWDDNHYVATLLPERRFYPVQNMPLSEVAISTDFVRDLYLVLNEAESDPAAPRSLRFHINPLAPWIWLGAAVMALGGLWLALPQRRKQYQDYYDDAA